MTLSEQQLAAAADNCLTDLDWWRSLLAEARVDHEAMPTARRMKVDARGGEHEIEDLAAMTARVSTESFERIAATVDQAPVVIRELLRQNAELRAQLQQAESCDLRRSGELCPALAPVRRLALATPLRRPA